MDTPRSYIKQLIGYITDDSAIAIHCNRNFGTKVTKERVRQIRSTMPQKKRA
jgi:hypothetical protein